MSSRFPDWLKKLDPTLECESENEIFQAFENRRQYSRGKFLRKLRASYSSMNMAFQMGSAAIVLVALIILVATNCCFALVFFSVAYAILQSKTGQSKVHGNFLPQRLNTVFSPSGFFETAAIDLWMTGCGGKKIFEAMYLETRLTTIQTLVFSVIALITFYIMLLFIFYTTGLSLYGLIIPTAALAYLLLELVLYALNVGMIDNQIKKLRLQRNRWLGKNLVSQSLLDSVLQILIYALVMFGGTIFFIVAGFLVFELRDLLVSNGYLSPASIFFEMVGYTYAAFVILCLALSFRITNILRKNRVRKLFFQLMESGSEAFESFMRRVVMEDPDYARQEVQQLHPAIRNQGTQRDIDA